MMKMRKQILGEKKMGPKRTLDEMMMMMMRKHKAKEQKEMKRQHFHLCIDDFQ